ncbi:MAG: sugar transferase [Pseudomonadota bacterium]
MFDFSEDQGRLGAAAIDLTVEKAQTIHEDWSKIAFDGVLAVLLLPLMVFAGLLLLILNPIFNPGPLLFRQTRMGLACKPFTALKFRTMAEVAVAERGAFDKLEAERISRFANVLRKMRFDELPQIINVLRGDMSMIGPRPDLYEHACTYIDEIPDYAMRHVVMPGITGYAQVTVGYVDGRVGVARKVAADHHYVQFASLKLDLWIAWRTIWVILSRQGC